MQSILLQLNAYKKLIIISLSPFSVKLSRDGERERNKTMKGGGEGRLLYMVGDLSLSS